MRKVAIIDSSPGNGHCFSFSAIINGLNPDELSNCPFQTILSYITAYTTPVSTLSKLFKIESVWMRRRDYAIQVSKFANIPHVASTIEESISKCDIVILTNDDPVTRNSLLLHILRLGKPVFVDKLLTRTYSQMEEIKQHLQYPRQILSSSSMQFVPEFDSVNLLDPTLLKMEIAIPNNWDLYAIHAIELFLSRINYNLSDWKVISTQGFMDGQRNVTLNRTSPYPLSVEIITHGRVEGDFIIKQEFVNGIVGVLKMKDPFESFCRLLLNFNHFLDREDSSKDYWEKQSKVIELFNAR